MKTQISTLLLFFGILGFSQNTYVPDDNFEQELINLGYDNGPLDDYVPTANINTLTGLDLGFKNVSDLTGLQDFTALLFIGVDGNPITTLDVSNNTALTEISANDVSLLTTINTSNNPDLGIIHAMRCQINSLDFSNNPDLLDVMLNDNKLTSLDVSNNLGLGALFVANNLLTSIDVSQNLDLRWLICNNNRISSLDLRQNFYMRYFNASNNQLTCLNVQNGNNFPHWMWDWVAIPMFNTLNNPNLSCITVDDVANSNTYWTQKDSWTSYSLNCGNCLLGNSEVSDEKISIYPNPTKDKIYFKNYREISEIKIFDLSGKLIKTEKHVTEFLDISKLKSGNYVLVINNAGKISSHKIIKN